MLKLVLLGPPGAGKGTQAVTIAKKYNILHISTGDIFRKNVGEGTELGLKAKEYMEKGELVPDAIVIEMVNDRLSQPDCKDGFLLDGFPRTMYQAEQLDKFLGEEGLDAVVDIQVDDDIILERISGRRMCRSCGAPYHIKYHPAPDNVCELCKGEVYQRTDDNEETVKKRLAVFHKENGPLIDYYKKTGKLTAVNGTGSQEEVFERVVKALGAKS